MLNFTGSLKVFVALEPCDLRKGFNGLVALVSERLKEDPLQGALFVFSNRSHTRLKMVYWDGTGIWILIKRRATHCLHSNLSTRPLRPQSILRPRAPGIGSVGRNAQHCLCAPPKPDDSWISDMDV